LCLQQLDYPTTRVPKQLIHNYITTIPWKYDKLINKIPRQKIRNCIVVARCIFIQYIVCNIYTVVVNHVLPLLTSCTLVTCNNYITIRINLVTNQRLLCNKCMTLSNTYDHATCIHFHHPIYMTFQLVATSMQLYFNLKFQI
jgi:hypothetical protein